MKQDVTERMKESGKVVREHLACGHWLDVSDLKPGKDQRLCPQCPGSAKKSERTRVAKAKAKVVTGPFTHDGAGKLTDDEKAALAADFEKDRESDHEMEKRKRLTPPLYCQHEVAVNGEMLACEHPSGHDGSHAHTRVTASVITPGEERSSA